MNFHDQLLRKYPDGKIPLRKSVHKAVEASHPKPTDNELVNRTAKAGLEASAEAASNEAVEHERRYQEKMDAVKRAPRELVSYYTDQARQHKANAELARSRADSFRRAAASLA